MMNRCMLNYGPVEDLQRTNERRAMDVLLNEPDEELEPALNTR